MRRFLGGRSRLARDSKNGKPLPTLSDDDTSIITARGDNEDCGAPLRAPVSKSRRRGKANNSGSAVAGDDGRGLGFGPTPPPSSAAGSAFGKDEMIARQLQAELDREEHDDSFDFDEDEMAAAQAAAQEQAAFAKGLVESLHGVTYNVNVVLPERESKSFPLDAMTLAGDVQMALEVEMNLCPGVTPTLLMFNGQVLHPDVPLHFAGIRDGDTLTLTVVAAGPDTHWQQAALEEMFDDEDDDPILRWAAGP